MAGDWIKMGTGLRRHPRRAMTEVGMAHHTLAPADASISVELVGTRRACMPKRCCAIGRTNGLRQTDNLQWLCRRSP